MYVEKAMFDELQQSLKIERSSLPWRRREFQAMFVLLLALSLIPVDLGRFDGVIGRIADAGHFWFYGLLSYLTARMTKRPASTAFALAAISGMIEIIQPYVDRDGNFEDFLVSSTGAITGAWWHSSYSLRWKLFPVIAFSAILCLPIISRYRSLDYQTAHYPELAAFDGLLWHELWGSNTPEDEEKPTSTLTSVGFGSEAVLLVTPIKDAHWAGVFYRNQRLQWLPHKSLDLTIQSTIEQELNLRIDDNGKCEEFDDRFNRTFLLKPGDNLLTIPLADIENGPLKRKLNLEKIKRLYIFLGDKPSDQGFVIKGMRLTG